MGLQGCVAIVAQQSFLSSDITPKVSLLTLSLSAFLVEDTSSLAHVDHFLQLDLQLLKTKLF